MKVTFRQSFARDLKKIKDKAVLEQIKRAIERVETVQNLSGMKELGKLSGSTGYYRIRIGAYRLGIAVQNDESHLCGACIGGTYTAISRDKTEFTSPRRVDEL